MYNSTSYACVSVIKKSANILESCIYFIRLRFTKSMSTINAHDNTRNVELTTCAYHSNIYCKPIGWDELSNCCINYISQCSMVIINLIFTIIILLVTWIQNVIIWSWVAADPSWNSFQNCKNIFNTMSSVYNMYIWHGQIYVCLNIMLIEKELLYDWNLSLFIHLFTHMNIPKCWILFYL